jgi:hypothetical protein
MCRCLLQQLDALRGRLALPGAVAQQQSLISQVTNKVTQIRAKQEKQNANPAKLVSHKK